MPILNRQLLSQKNKEYIEATGKPPIFRDSFPVAILIAALPLVSCDISF